MCFIQHILPAQKPIANITIHKTIFQNQDLHLHPESHAHDIAGAGRAAGRTADFLLCFFIISLPFG